jgi:hypothetical protein
MLMRRLFVLAAAGAAIAGARAAHAQTITCTPITSLPFTTTAAGPYCLTGNLTFADNSPVGASPAITVGFSGAVIDFRGYRLVYNGGLTSYNPAIRVLAGNSNVVIRNGLISSFGTGVETSSAGTIVEDMRFFDDGRTNGAGVMIQDGADGAIVRRCYIRSSQVGVFVVASEARVVDNDIYGSDTFRDIGILAAADNTFVVGNRLGRMNEGIRYDAGNSGKYRDNLTSNVTTPYKGGTNAGNNN